MDMATQLNTSTAAGASMARAVALTFASCAAAVALCACGQAAPTDQEAQEALLTEMSKQGGSQMRRMFGEDIKKMKLVGCSKGDTGSFKCDWTDGPMGAGTGRFAKSKDGWVFVGAGG